MGQLVTNYGLLGNSSYVDRRAVAIVKTIFYFLFFICGKPTKFRHVSASYFPLRPCTPSRIHSGVIYGGPMQLTVG
jgi:hypothetical protein